MPPVLEPHRSHVDGLAFIGLSLTRKGVRGHPVSATHQQAFDLDLVQDRDYTNIFSTDDNGWLVGGGEPGPPTSYKLAARDSAHVEIMRIGTYRADWGGVPREVLVEALKQGEILIPEITAVPTAVVANADKPPELEIRFDMVPEKPDFDNLDAPLPFNWQLRFIQNQLFHKFKYPSRFNPGSFHSTILRKAEFRSQTARDAYFQKCKAAVDGWMQLGPKPLIPEEVSADIKTINCTRREPRIEGKEDEEAGKDESSDDDDGMGDYYRSGLWLFTDRNNISHRFLPNFLPPYDSPLKKKLILDILKEEWDEGTMAFQPIGFKKEPTPVQQPKASPSFVGDVEDPKLDDESIVRETKITVEENPKPPVAPTAPSTTSMTGPTTPPRTNVNSTTKSTPLTPLGIDQEKELAMAKGMFDPKDEDGFAHFVSSFGQEVSHMASSLCAQAFDGEDNVSDDIIMKPGEEEKSSKDLSNQALLRTMKKSSPSKKTSTSTTSPTISQDLVDSPSDE